MIPWPVLWQEYIKPIGGLLVLPVVLFREAKQQRDLWKNKGYTPLQGREEEGS